MRITQVPHCTVSGGAFCGIDGISATCDWGTNGCGWSPPEHPVVIKSPKITAAKMQAILEICTIDSPSARIGPDWAHY
jgi:hypothetical protein